MPTLAPSYQKKSSLQEPLCFAKSLKSATSLHAGKFAEGFDNHKPVTMVQSQIVSSANVEPKQFNRLANMAKHVEDDHDFHHFNDTPKTESLYSSSIFTRK
jgi:tRNA isopentenyl-2-thiomethyl-A-37 hydroxylase MiaE